MSTDSARQATLVSPEPHVIMIVDDKKANRQLLCRALEADYTCLQAEDAQSCIEQLETHQPTAFLLDVRLPDLNGHDLCRTIRSKKPYRSCPIVFISALNDSQQIVAAYKAGADDYISKPFDISAVKLKLDGLIQRQTLISEEIVQVTELAKTAIENSGELGVVNQFLEGLRECEDYDQLANHVVTHCQSFRVDAVIALHLENSLVTKSTVGKANELELKLLRYGQESGRIVTFGNRCLFNFDGCSLLVRAMPENSDKAGRYRDHLASLLHGVESRLKSLKSEVDLRRYQQGIIHQIVTESREALDTMLDQFKQHDQSNRQILENFVEEMQIAFSYLDLSEEQEEGLSQILSDSVTRISASQQTGIELDKRFTHIIHSLEQVSRTPKNLP